MMEQGNRLGRGIRILAATALLLSACTWGLPPAADDADAGRAVQVKAELIRSLQEDAAAIHVEVENKTVRLRGFAETEAVKKKAGNVARSAEGVNEVINEIEVK